MFMKCVMEVEYVLFLLYFSMEIKFYLIFEIHE